MAKRPQGDTQSVLIVEDEKDLRDIYEMKFTSEGFTTDVAENGLEALELLENGCCPSIILLDLVMPKMGGFQFLEERAKLRSVKNIPVFVLSNLSQDFEIKEGIRLKADKYLIKAHYTPDEIVEKVRVFLYGKK